VDGNPIKNQGSWCVVPVFNEATVFKPVIENLLKVFPTVVCVDDGSSDGSGRIAEECGAILVQHSTNLGQGAALATGIEFAASHESCRYIVTFDADGQHQTEDAIKMLDHLINENLDIVFASRFLVKKSDKPPLIKRIVLKIGTKITNSLTGTRLTDTHNGLRVMTVETARRLNITQFGMAHASEIIAEVSRNKLNYGEFPVSIVYTDYSKSKGQSLLNGINILIDLIWK